MMETKVWIALCALLLVHSGSTNDDHAAAATASSTASSAQENVGPEAPDAPSPDGSVTNTNTSGTGSSGGNATVTPEIKKDANIVSTTEAAVPENKLTSQPLLPPSPASHTPTTPTTTTTITTISITSTAAGPTHSTHTTTTTTTTTVDTPTATPRTETTHHAALPDSAAASNQPTLNATLAPTSGPTPATPEPPKPETSTTTTAAAAIVTASSISSTGSSQEAPSSESSTLAPPQKTSHPDEHPEASSEAQPTHAVTPPLSSSAQAKPHADNPSQLNVGDDPTMVHDSPTLHPLLAGLVSAFIITAVIITLLLFLKLRRRDNRPEFRRLQDLPMDDMMEDTPLSMYSY